MLPIDLAFQVREIGSTGAGASDTSAVPTMHNNDWVRRLSNGLRQKHKLLIDRSMTLLPFTLNDQTPRILFGVIDHDVDHPRSIHTCPPHALLMAAAAAGIRDDARDVTLENVPGPLWAQWARFHAGFTHTRVCVVSP